MGSLPDLCVFLAQKKYQGLSAELLCLSYSLNTDTVLVFQYSSEYPTNIQDHHSRSEISSAKSQNCYAQVTLACQVEDAYS